MLILAFLSAITRMEISSKAEHRRYFFATCTPNNDLCRWTGDNASKLKQALGRLF